MEPIEDVGMSRVIRDPLNVEGLRRVGAKKSPELGEHSQEILTELGYGSEQIAEFLAAGVI
jgi:formyl-CoA transferase